MSADLGDARGLARGGLTVLREGVAFDLASLLGARGGEAWDLHERHMNAQMVRVLRTIGFDRLYVRAEGPYLYDESGARYLDFLSGFGVFALGRNHPTVARALHDALDARLASLVQMDVHPLAGLLAEALVARAPFCERVFFCSSGTEAVEAALKFARAATRRPRILYCERAFHGLTLGSLSVNGNAEFRDGFGPLLPACDAVPFGDAAALERELRRGDVAAFLAEPIQGHGVFEAPPAYWQSAQALCRKHGALLAIDEVQTGLGRTGRFFAFEHAGIEPDLILVAKALSGGFVPVGAVLARRDVFDRVFDRMDRVVVHGSTFSKNVLAMAAGLATLHVIDDEKLLERAASAGALFRERLEPMCARFEMFSRVRGRGLMLGLDFAEPRSLKLKAAWKLAHAASASLFAQLVIIPLMKKHRVLTQVAGHGSDCVKLLPPLVVSDDDIDWFCRAFEEVVADLHTFPGPIWEVGADLAKNALRA